MGVEGRAMVNETNEGLWDWDVKTGEVHFFAGWTGILGPEGEEARTTVDDWLARVHPDDIDLVRLQLSKHLEGLTTQFECEHRVLHRDGSYRWVLARGTAIRDADGNPYRMTGSLADVDERKRAEEQLVRDALYDRLTGLPNRNLLLDRLRHIFRRRERLGDYRLCAILLLDVDHFKSVNDSLGHAMGDALLVELAHRLETCARPVDTVARVGNDEFILLIDGIRTIASVVSVTERIQKLIGEPVDLNGNFVHPTVSVGIAVSGADHERPDDILLDADIAMYRAKAQGAGHYLRFDPSMRERAGTLLARLG